MHKFINNIAIGDKANFTFLDMEFDTVDIFFKKNWKRLLINVLCNQKSNISGLQLSSEI